MKRIVLAVTNDLTYDQRMHRIAASLTRMGYRVTLVGRVRPQSIPIDNKAFDQHRMPCFFEKGAAFYAEYNLRLLTFLLRRSWDAVGVVDLDTLPAGTIAALLKRKARVFDAHEYFTEVPEVTDRPFVKMIWEGVARAFLPFYRHAYTVGPALAGLFSEKYGIPFGVVRNVPAPETFVADSFLGTEGNDPLSAPEDAGTLSMTEAIDPLSATKVAGTGDNRIILYQGALNEGRGIEAMLEAMTQLPGVELWLAGEGDLSDALRRRARVLGLEDKVRFLGFVKPAELKSLTRQAWLGLNLLENRGLSYYYSLANKYFDYVQAGVPVLTMDFPEYRTLQEQFPVAVLLTDLNVGTIVQAVNQLLQERRFYEERVQFCHKARNEWAWEKEEATLLDIWRQAMAVEPSISTSQPTRSSP